MQFYFAYKGVAILFFAAEVLQFWGEDGGRGGLFLVAQVLQFYFWFVCCLMAYQPS